MNDLVAVTFDFWNTLLYEEAGHLRGRRLSAWMGILEDEGFVAERHALEEAFEHSWGRYVEAWMTNHQYQATVAAEAVLDHLGYQLPDDVRVGLIDAFANAGRDATLHPAPNIEACLRTLHDAGLRIGIICDVGMTPSNLLREHLDRLDLLRYFDHWSFSDDVGVYKPDNRIFEHALSGLGVDTPARAAHVGDLRRTDVGGARAAGMVSVRYTGVADEPVPEGDLSLPEADYVVDDHALLPAVLGVPGLPTS